MCQCLKLRQVSGLLASEWGGPGFADYLGMKNFRIFSQNGISRIWLSAFLLATAGLIVLSFLSEVRQAQDSVSQYVGIWEDDIARANLFLGDLSLQEKILNQLQQVHPAVRVVDAEGANARLCIFQTAMPITLNSLPAGEVVACFQFAELAAQAVTSPALLLGILLGLTFLAVGYKREFANRLQEQRLEAELARNREVAEISRQVAHDIRGPLMALNTLSQLSHEMSSEKRELFHNAVSRIRGIAEDLLVRGQAFKAPESANVAKVVQQDLTTLLESLLKEYRFAHGQVDFSLHKHTTSGSVPVNLDPVKLQRVVGNILNNALEALPESDASISLTLMERKDHWLLQIMDNGCGIPEEILPQLTVQGATFGKEKGNGLGLYDARKTLEAIGGSLQIRSRVGVGTQVILLFPKVEQSSLDRPTRAVHS